MFLIAKKGLFLSSYRDFINRSYMIKKISQAKNLILG